MCLLYSEALDLPVFTCAVRPAVKLWQIPALEHVLETAHPVFFVLKAFLRGASRHITRFKMVELRCWLLFWKISFSLIWRVWMFLWPRPLIHEYLFSKWISAESCKMDLRASQNRMFIRWAKTIRWWCLLQYILALKSLSIHTRLGKCLNVEMLNEKIPRLCIL